MEMQHFFYAPHNIIFKMHDVVLCVLCMSQHVIWFTLTYGVGAYHNFMFVILIPISGEV
jgi:hypothetical protein